MITILADIGRRLTYHGLYDLAVSFTSLGLEVSPPGLKFEFASSLTQSLMATRRLVEAREVALRDLSCPSAGCPARTRNEMVLESLALLTEISIGCNKPEEAIKYGIQAVGFSNQLSYAELEEEYIQTCLTRAYTYAGSAAEELGRLDEALEWDTAARMTQGHATMEMASRCITKAVEMEGADHKDAERAIRGAIQKMNEQLRAPCEGGRRRAVECRTSTDVKNRRRPYEMLVKVLLAKGTEEAREEALEVLKKVDEMKAEEEELTKVLCRQIETELLSR